VTWCVTDPVLEWRQLGARAGRALTAQAYAELAATRATVIMDPSPTTLARAVRLTSEPNVSNRTARTAWPVDGAV
jgi:hypothetical protein